MKALILAAGRAIRLRPLTDRLPKCLLPVGGKSILEHQLEALTTLPVFKEAVIVTGYRSEAIKAHLEKVTARYPFPIRTVKNPEYATTNNLYSFWIAGPLIEGSPSLILYGDLLFHPAILKRGRFENPSITLFIDRRIAEETAKVKLSGDRVLAVGKALAPQEAMGTFIGLFTCSKEGGRLLLEEAERLVRRGEVEHYITTALEGLIAKGVSIGFIETGDLPWFDLDTPEEVELARAVWKRFP